MERNNYSHAIGQVVTPPSLKEKTRHMLVSEITKRKSIWTIRNIMVVAAVFVLLIGTGIWVTGIPGSNIPEENASGALELNFVSITEDVPPVRMAAAYPLRQQVALEELPGSLPYKPPYGFDPPEGRIIKFFFEPSPTHDAVFGEAEYRAKSGALLTVIFTDAPMLYLPVEISGSRVADVVVGAGYSEKDNIFYAAYEQNGYTYLLASEGMDRQAFAGVLEHFITG